MITISQNSRNESVVEVLSEETKNAVYQWDSADFHLYTHFRRKLIDQIDRYGIEQMQRAVRILKATIAAELKRCEFNAALAHDQSDARIAPLAWNLAVMKPSSRMIRDERCLMLAMNEVAFTDMMRDVHNHRLQNEHCVIDT